MWPCHDYARGYACYQDFLQQIFHSHCTSLCVQVHQQLLLSAYVNRQYLTNYDNHLLSIPLASFMSLWYSRRDVPNFHTMAPRDVWVMWWRVYVRPLLVYAAHTLTSPHTSQRWALKQHSDEPSKITVLSSKRAQRWALKHHCAEPSNITVLCPQTSQL
jgi:hypothetical protein